MLPNRRMRVVGPIYKKLRLREILPRRFFKSYAPLRNARSEVCAGGALLGDWTGPEVIGIPYTR
jgi:hypothetical protein